ncbi:MAG: hypothetical protein QME65_05670 [Candidatus Omnitrophota bacterium]|nr:hypothetical protein [Candidatus Omnitrophota bacterium]
MKIHRSRLTLNKTLNDARYFSVNRRRYQRKSASTGFTYIEILITLAVMAVLFIPMMRLFTHGLFSASISGELISAVNLGRWEMERLKNLNLTKEQLKKEGDAWIPPLEEEPFEMNNAKWRIRRRINPESDPVEVSVRVFLADNLNKPAAALDTLFEDNLWIEERVK